MRRPLAVVLAAVLSLPVALRAQAPDVDIIVRGGRIVDGTGAPRYRADLAIKGDRIAAIGRLDRARARRLIDATGQVVAPGFIDMMGQTGEIFITKGGEPAINVLPQGITTIRAGEGASPAPLEGEAARAKGWRTMREYFRKLEGAGTPLNVAQNIGHTQVRELMIGDVARQATPAELDRMRAYVEEAMQAGAIGLSTSLIYPPAIYASEAEITALAAVAGKHGGRYYTHMRNEGDRLLEAIDEALRIGAAANTPVYIYHLKTAGQGNWGKKDGWEVFFDIAQTDAFAMPQTMSEANKIKAMHEPFTSFDTDAGPASDWSATTQPRAWGGFPRIFARYVRALGALSLEEAVQKSSAAAANEIGAYDRGRLAPGLAADVVVLDPKRIRDRATFAEPSLQAEGVNHVVVNGALAPENGKNTGAKSGIVLRGPGWDGKN